MRSYNLVCPIEIIEDGVLRRFANHGKGDKDCWYICFDNGGGVFGDWSSGLNETWTPHNARLSDKDKDKLNKQILVARQKYYAEKTASYEETAQKVLEQWQRLSDTGTSLYLSKKQAQPFNVRFDQNNLVIPLKDIDGKLWSLQTVIADGTKRFQSGGKKQGCFHSIGDIQSSPSIYVCEGYATGASIYQATGITTIIAFDAGNLTPVIDSIRSKYPTIALTIAADNDQWKEVNVGRDKAEEAAQKYGCQVILPKFSDEYVATKPTDFNDLHVLCGLEEVKNQLFQTPKEKRLPMPSGFLLKKDGLYYEEDWVCSPLEILAYTRDENSENWGRLVRFSDLDNHVHTHALPMKFLSGDCIDLYCLLLAAGLRITTIRRLRSKLTDYLQSFKTDKRALCTSHIGWHGDHFILPDGAIPATDGIYLQSDNSNFIGYRMGGTLGQWQEHIAIPCQGNSRLIFALCCAFAAPLLSLVGSESGGFNFIGSSSIGKSTALSVAASVWGSPKYIQQWKATGNALEAIAEAHNNTLLCLDELGQVDGKEAGEIAYMLANGSGKSRLKAKGGLRRKFEWKTLFLSTGEISIADKLKEAAKRFQAGMLIRMVDIPADAGTGHRLFDTIHEFQDGRGLAQHLKDKTGQYYGTAIRPFLEVLPTIKQALPQTIEKVRLDFFARNISPDADGQIKRVAERFVIVAAAGELAIDLGVLPYEGGTALEAIRVCFNAWIESRGGLGNYETEEAITQVKTFIEANQSSRFAILQDGYIDEQRITHQAGYKRLTWENEYEFFIFPKVFDAEVCKGLNPRFVKHALAEQGFLLKDGTGKYTKPISLPKGKKRMIHLAPQIFCEVK